MKRTKELFWGRKAVYGVMAVIIAFAVCFFAEAFSIVSHAQSEGTVIAKSANIRKEANGSSAVVGSAAKDAKISINHQTTASDGTVWYQIFVDANTLGYIRSDLVQITDGSTPPTQAASSATTTTTTTTTTTPVTTPVEETPVDVEAVNPISATVTGGQMVRVRGNASTTSQILTTVQNGMALTVTGTANGTDGKVWHQVTFIDNGATVTGFIRSDYVALSGELTPVTSEDAGTEQPEESTPPQESLETKKYETKYTNDKWYLIDNEIAGQYVIDDMFAAAETNKKLYEDEHEKVQSQKLAIVILVMLMIAMAAAIAYLLYKIKDMKDSAYFSEVERETIQRRNEVKSQRNGQNVMHTVGAENRQPAKTAGTAFAQGGRPVSQARPTGTVQGSRPVSQTRPAQTGQPQGGRPTGQARPATTAQGVKPASQTRPAQTGQPQGSRPTGQTRPAKPAKANPSGVNNAQNQAWKSKNFMQEDDEFEFEFLNWDGEEEI